MLRNRKGSVLIDALICTVITSVCASLVAACLRTHMHVKDSIGRKEELLEERYEGAVEEMPVSIDCEEEACRRKEEDTEEEEADSS